MNLGDGLKLETELLDGKTKLILASYERKPKTALKMGNKARTPKQPLRMTQTGHVLKSTQNTDGRNGSLLQKGRAAAESSLAKGDKNRMLFSPTKSFSKEDTDNDHLCVQRRTAAETPDSWRTEKDKQSAVFKQKPQRKHITVEDLRNSLVCLTEEQLQQILMAVSQGNRPILHTENGKKEEKCQNNLHLNNFPNESKDQNMMGSPQKAENVSPVPDENNSVLNKKQKISQQCEQKIAVKTVWKPADMFSTLGEREREKSVLEAKKFQWRKELDEQVALKKKEKAASEEQKKCPWSRCRDAKLIWDNVQLVDGWQSSMSPSSILSRSPNPRLSAHPAGDSVPGTSQTLQMTPPAEFHSAAEETQVLKTVSKGDLSEAVPDSCCAPRGKPSTFSSPDLPAAIRTAFVLGEAAPLEHPFSAVKREQQKKWIEELNKQKEEDKQRKLQEKIIYSKGEEHDRWAMHFDSLKLYPNSQSQLSSRAAQKQPDYFCMSPDAQEMTDVSSPYTPLSGSQLGPSEEENLGKSIKETATTNLEKTNFLRSMTALLDPAQIEERDRRRQKQLEHQKAITAQVEEKRRKKQLEEQQRKQEEEEEERRLAREREEMQRRFEADLLEQRRKEEIMTLKTNELYQTMQKAQELAQRLKQEQRIRELEQKGHDTSNLLRNLGASRLDFSDQMSAKVSQGINTATSPRKDTAVQTDDLHTGRAASAEADTEPMPESTLTDLLSPELSVELDRRFNSKSKKEGLQEDKKASLEKENSRRDDLYDQFAKTEKQTPHKGKCAKRPDWNRNKPVKRYIPASERYPKHLQRQREENKVRRQMELLQLLERNTPGSLSVPRDISPEGTYSPHEETNSRAKGPRGHKEEELKKINSSKERSESPPVPAVKNRLQQTQLKQTNAAHPPEPPHFIPYVRTNEIYCLDPDVPSPRPSAYDPQYPYLNDSDYQEQIIGSDNVRDPLLNPNLVKNRDRQQAILKGLSDLRQGLLQKQKELETHLIPLASSQEDFDSPF
ncbi:coiled-coil domain-containing protein 66 isoform X2 [Dromiciops gliroides]|uniref:coiled-coil domain-containing protein 66 isoform X2 n=1 Tax=Dromiciops gliroides TaxID=33562 RepID=UPI001CC5D58E|nr:coiled-coil domain-containing protein 66 isoform X2 [Dromiciops gliroides]